MSNNLVRIQGGDDDLGYWQCRQCGKRYKQLGPGFTKHNKKCPNMTEAPTQPSESKTERNIQKFPNNISGDILRRTLGEDAYEELMKKYLAARLKGSPKDRQNWLTEPLTEQELKDLYFYAVDLENPLTMLEYSASRGYTAGILYAKCIRLAARFLAQHPQALKEAVQQDISPKED